MTNRMALDHDKQTGSSGEFKPTEQPLKKYLITNVVYGDLYLGLFVEQHLRSVLDDTNLPALAGKYDVTYMIYTDADTIAKIMDVKQGEKFGEWDRATQVKRLRHPNFKRLAATVNLKFNMLNWLSEDQNRFNMRYSVLLDTFKDSVKAALDTDSLLTAWVADLVVAKHFFPKVLHRIEQGHGAVFVLPMRTAAEPMRAALMQFNRALEPYELFALGFRNLHPLWVACEWENRRFTTLPFSMLWSGKRGIQVRSFSLTPVVFKPKPEMIQGRGMIDGDVPGLCDNPYWAINWTEAPVMGVEPLFCYYPPFCNKTPKASNVMLDNSPPKLGRLRIWTRLALHPSQRPYARRTLYYPDKKNARISKWRRFKQWLFIRIIT